MGVTTYRFRYTPLPTTKKLYVIQYNSPMILGRVLRQALVAHFLLILSKVKSKN